MGITRANSLFFLKGWSVSQLTFVVHGRLLGNEGHVGSGGSINRSTENAVVGVRCTCERFPSATGEGVVTLGVFADPNPDGLALNLLILADRTGLLSRPLGHSCASVSTD